GRKKGEPQRTQRTQRRKEKRVRVVPGRRRGLQVVEGSGVRRKRVVKKGVGEPTLSDPFRHAKDIGMTPE
ncbi:MAG TPA: hypothetical protein VFT74_04665, partial [Isosphaeraceae bacterium]|nr:hypothetical protein [Isosphaeraceae bacterium]